MDKETIEKMVEMGYNQAKEQKHIIEKFIINDEINSETLSQSESDVIHKIISDVENNNLSEHSNIVGIKDASDNLARTLSIRLELKNDFALLSGDDVTATGFMAQGGNGCISVCSNVAPKLNAKLYDLWDECKFDEVWNIRNLLHPLNIALFSEPNPVPIKYACSIINKCLPEIRPPMVPLSSHTKERIKKCMKDAGIIY